MICGKIIYISRSEAKNAIRGFHLDQSKGYYGKTKKMPKESYFCNDCNGWHTFSGPKNKIRHKAKSMSTEIVKPVKKVVKDGKFLRIVNFNK